jgi:hypothetical protein
VEEVHWRGKNEAAQVRPAICSGAMCWIFQPFEKISPQHRRQHGVDFRVRVLEQTGSLGVVTKNCSDGQVSSRPMALATC